MAYQFSASNYREATTGQLSGSAADAATYSMWLRRDSDLGNYSTFWTSRGANTLALITDSGGDNLRLDVDYDSGANTWSGEPAGFVALPVGDWVYVAIVQSTTTINLYTADLGDTTLTDHGTSTVTASPNFADGVGLGWYLNVGFEASGSMAFYREWSAALTQSDLEAELNSTTAVRSSGLNREYRFANGALGTDSSGAGHGNIVPGGSSGGSFTADPTFTATVNGTAASSFTYTAPAAGLVTVLGAADGTFTYTAPAVGTVGNAATIGGIAAAVFLFTAAAVGRRVVGVLEDVVDVTVVDTRIEASVL